MIKYLIGALTGSIFGYCVLYLAIGCSTGSCSITANPYISIAYGIVFGLLVAGLIKTPVKTKKSDDDN